MSVPILNSVDLFNKINECRQPWHQDYLAMYSSVFGGIVTDPALMVIPIDDHLVHRADGVFDVFKCVNGKAYCLDEHLNRLQRSAAPLGLNMPDVFQDIEKIIKAAVKAGNAGDVLVRIIVSRGPGGFGTNPYECPASQLYVVVTRLKPPKPEKYVNGVSIISAPVPVKPRVFANIKSCDYLGNVLVKKAAMEAQVDFAVNYDENGFLAEGSTENIFLISPDQKMLIPKFERVLRGVTLSRVTHLAETLVKEGMLKGIEGADIDRELAASCPEVMLCGTTLDILPVTVWDGRRIGDGKPGPVAGRLLELIKKDITENDEVLTTLLD